MSNTTTAALSMKLLIDRKAQRVLFAEASKDVVDFLFSLLALPLGAVAKLLTAGAGAGSVVPLDGPAAPSSSVAKLLPTVGAMVGSVGNLHRSMEALDTGHVFRREATDAQLEPAVVQLVVAAAAPASDGCLYRCKGCVCSPRCYTTPRGSAARLAPCARAR